MPSVTRLLPTSLAWLPTSPLTVGDTAMLDCLWLPKHTVLFNASESARKSLSSPSCLTNLISLSKSFSETLPDRSHRSGLPPCLTQASAVLSADSQYLLASTDGLIPP